MPKNISDCSFFSIMDKRIQLFTGALFLDPSRGSPTVCETTLHMTLVFPGATDNEKCLRYAVCSLSKLLANYTNGYIVLI